MYELDLLLNVGYTIIYSDWKIKVGSEQFLTLFCGKDMYEYTLKKILYKIITYIFIHNIYNVVYQYINN